MNFGNILIYSRYILNQEMRYHAPRVAVKDMIWSMEQIIWQNNNR
jgi:hypothetical protein